MDSFFWYYISAWATACFIALAMMILDRQHLVLFQGSYWRFLLQGWKTSTFLVAMTGMVVIAPYTGDYTWDYYDAAFMSILTFTTAPWVVGVIYRLLQRRSSIKQVYIAVCLAMFSASWSYDLYLLLRDGVYPVTWYSNIFASLFLYICGGLMWNLELKPGRGVIFGFMEPEWPAVYDTRFLSRVFWYALPFMMIAGALIINFLF